MDGQTLVLIIALIVFLVALLAEKLQKEMLIRDKKLKQEDRYKKIREACEMAADEYKKGFDDDEWLEAHGCGDSKSTPYINMNKILSEEEFWEAVACDDAKRHVEFWQKANCQL